MPNSLHALVNQVIIPHVNYFIPKIYEERENYTLEGIKPFGGSDKFIAGKIIQAFTFTVLQTNRDTSQTSDYIHMLREIINFTAPREMETWSILYYVKGLYRLEQHGLLNEVLSSETKTMLQEKLDWRTFVNTETWALIDKPTNYYGVAFGIARFRELLGWETETYSSVIFGKLMQHVNTYSGTHQFMDETPGEGRFDRYSLLIPGEVCSLLTDTGLEVPQQLLDMLRKSSEIFLHIANENGNGVSYGRSIGAYGDTAPMEVLSIAARLGVLTDEEQRDAYAYCSFIAQKFVDFWIDPAIHSINMWDDGRKTDAYRHKGRVLGENLSLCSQFFQCNDYWVQLGFQDISSFSGFNSKAYHLYRFAEGDYDRGLLIYRHGQRVIQLPLINGGSGSDGGEEPIRYYCSTPYLPIPTVSRLLETPPGSHYPQLVPQLTLNDGSVVMPIAYLQNISVQPVNEGVSVTYTQEQLCRLGEPYPQQDKRLASQTTYTLQPGNISRADTFTFDAKDAVQSVYMEFATYSQEPIVQGNKVTFLKGDITEIELDGFVVHHVEDIQDDSEYDTPHGRLQTKITFVAQHIHFASPFHVAWRMKYK